MKSLLSQQRSANHNQSCSMLYLVAVILLLAAAPAFASEEAPESPLAHEQKQIEDDTKLPARSRRTLFRARNHQDAGNHAEAIETIGSWLADDPERDHHLLRITLAVNRQKLDQMPEALADLRVAVALEPRFGRAWLIRGEIAYEQGLFSEAGEAFATGHRLVPNARVEFLYYSAVSYLLADQSDSALITLTKILRDNRTDASLVWYQALVAAATAAEKPEQAAPFMNNLLADFPDEAGTWYLAYQHAIGLENYRMATICLSITGYMRDLTVGELIQLGNLYAMIEVPAKAANYYEQALVMDPEKNIVQQYERLASVWMAAHQYDQALAALERGIDISDNHRLWSLVGDLQYTKRNYPKALEAFSRACELDANFGRSWLMRGYCALELDQKKAARQYLLRAAEFSDFSKNAQRLLDQLSFSAASN